MKDIDFDRAALLFNIMEKAATVGPMMSSISGEAGEELKHINEDCRQNALERADERRREEADRIAAEQQLHAEQNADEVGVLEEPEPIDPRTPRAIPAAALRRPNV